MTENSLQDYFGKDYWEARDKFRAGADKAGTAHLIFPHPHQKDVGGREFTVDLAWIGPADAEKVLVTMSGLHGVEGFAGSAVQTGLFEEFGRDFLPEGVAYCAIHAINPCGFAWLRRVNEDNVDLNRNFVNFDKPLPENPGYEELAPSIIPKMWDEPSVRARWQAFEAYEKENGSSALSMALHGGQYTDHQGVSFGGIKPAWSRNMLRVLLERFLNKATHVAFVDIHTGLGDFGETVLYAVTSAPETGDRAKAMFGDDITVMHAGAAEGEGPRVFSGFSTPAIERVIAPNWFAGVTLEYGTYERKTTWDAQHGDVWLRYKGDLESDLGSRLKDKIKRAYYPETDQWRSAVWNHAREFIPGVAQRLAGV